MATSVSDASFFLQGLLGRCLVAYMAGVEDADTVLRWARGEVVAIRRESEKRTRAAYKIARLLVRRDSPRVVKAWFVGPDPQLDGVSPA